jgi:hypothetical protein
MMIFNKIIIGKSEVNPDCCYYQIFKKAPWESPPKGAFQSICGNLAVVAFRL